MTRTARVRIAVAVDPNGTWKGYGWSKNDGTADEECMFDSQADGMMPGERWYWITADLPIPELQEVEATVEEVES
jgi:hypothetical protein